MTNRFLSKSKALQVICALIFLFAYTIYAASSMKACGTLFHTVLGVDSATAMYVAAAIIVAYTFLGGFSAVCWTDFFQGMLMLASLLIAPIFALFVIRSGQGAPTGSYALPQGYWNLFTDWREVVSGLGWGLGYFGMPHIIVRFMSLESQKSLRKSAKIGITWNVLIVVFSVAAGCIGHVLLGDIHDHSTVFIQMVRMLFPGVLSGILLSAILAASMSTADSQLLASASAFASDVYQPIIRRGKAGNREMLWMGRLVVLVISVAAVLIASHPEAGSIMDLVSNAWGMFGAAFGPAILLSLFWKRFNFQGAVAGIVVGAVVDGLWLAFLASTGIYEIIPGFAAGLLAAVTVSLATPAPDRDVEVLFDRAVSYQD